MHFLYVSMYLYVFVCIFKDTYKIHTWYIQIKQCKIHTDTTVQRRYCICIYRYVSVCNVSISYMRMYLYVFVCIFQMCTRHSTTIHSFIPSNLPPARRCQRRVLMITQVHVASMRSQEGPEACGLNARPPLGSRWARSWPMCWCSTAGCLIQAVRLGRSCPFKSRSPSYGTCCGGSCRIHPLGARAAGRGCVRAEQRTQQGLGRACTAAWCQSRRCLATKLGPPGDSSRRRSQSGHTGTPWHSQSLCGFASWKSG